MISSPCNCDIPGVSNTINFFLSLLYFGIYLLLYIRKKITTDIFILQYTFVIFFITGIYKMTLSDNKLGMTKEIIAAKVLPFLFPLSIENGLTVLQYNAVMALIKVILKSSIQ